MEKKRKGKGVYGVDGGDDAWEGDPVAWAAAAAADAEWASDSEGVGAVCDQDEQYDEFCACVDSALDFDLESECPYMCGMYNVDDEVDVDEDVSEVSTPRVDFRRFRVWDRDHERFR